MAEWHLAPCLVVGRDEINTRWPNRDRTSDGTIGDAAHQARTSDHNPDEDNASVNAEDLDEDIHHLGANGSSPEIWEIIAAFERLPFAHYWIYEGLVASADSGWQRHPYTGDSPHDKHAHLSVRHGDQYENDTRPWGLIEDMIDQAAVDRIWGKDVEPGDGTYSAWGSLHDAREWAKAGRDNGAAAVKAIEELADAVAARFDALELQAPEIDYDRLADALLRRVLAPPA